MSSLRSACATIMAVLLVALGVTGCTIGTGADSQPSEAAPEPPAISVKDGAEEVNPDEPVTVTAGDAALKDVTMTNETGYEVEAELSEDSQSWTTTETLGYYRTYTVTAEDVDGNTSTATFETINPTTTTSVYLSPLDGSTVGVGQTVNFRFSNAVSDREAAQEALEVTTSPEVEGAFFWVSNYEVRWRPKDYWEPGTTVTAKANIYGEDLGDGAYGESDNAISFTIGDRVESVVDDNTKTMTVYRNGEQINQMPVSLGSNTYPTPNGVYIVGGLYPEIVMDSETFGLSYDEGGYKLTVKWATQISYSGIYVHAAPWSVWAQGSQNTSHGCINVSTANAEWFQSISKPGDIVTVQNTVGGTLSGYDGLGDWNIPWETWSAGNADES